MLKNLDPQRKCGLVNFTSNAHCNNVSNYEIFSQRINKAFILKYFKKNERKILKVFLLVHLHQLFFELFQNKMHRNQNDFSKESYIMDNKIIQFLIQKIVETGEYTLEGIAYHSRIPFDVIYDAARGVNNQLTITPWLKIVSLYLQIKPDIAHMLVNKLIEIKNKNQTAFLSLLNDP